MRDPGSSDAGTGRDLQRMKVGPYPPSYAVEVSWAPALVPI